MVTCDLADLQQTLMLDIQNYFLIIISAKMLIKQNKKPFTVILYNL